LRQRQPADHIAILVRGRNHLNDVVVALRARQLAWNASEIDPLLSYSVIADLFSLLRALLNPGDVTAWLALLRSPLAGLGLADLELLAQHAKSSRCTLWRVLLNHQECPLSAEGARRLQRCVPVLRKARRLRQRLPLRDVLEKSWLELGGPAAVADAGMLPNIAAFFTLVEQQAEHGDIVDIHDFEERLHASHGSAQASDVKLDIMTIHKSKGLEFDHVILCGLDRKPRSNDAPLLRWRDFPDVHANPRLLLGLTHKRGQQADALYQFLKREEDCREDYEITRLLYIGVTRAAKSVWLFGTVTEAKSKTENRVFKGNPKSLLNSVLPVLLEHKQHLQVELVMPAPAPLQDDGAASGTPQQLQRLPAGWHSPLPQPLLDDSVEESVEYLDEYDNLASRTFGNLVHLGLKLLVEQGPQALQRSLGMPYWRLQLARLYPDAGIREALLSQLRAHLLPEAAAAGAQWLFRRDHQQDACELELFDHRNGLRRYVVDRTFVDADGVRWIVDYKTAMPSGTQSVQVFLAEQASRYRGQLETYAALLAAHTGDDPLRCRMALYFTGLGQLHELTRLPLASA
jgi:ATP-dependent exoDNAse (exonuclease V) beta subunit